MKKWLDMNKYYILAWTIPVVIMALIFIYMGVYPFGDESLLTIDLGQQYVDLYRYYRDNMFQDPSSIFYSFHKSLGGEMTGIWGYYLASPLNILFFFFPAYQLDLAVTVMTLIKYGLAGLTMYYFLFKQFKGGPAFSLVFSSAYALSSYMVVYQMNLMWTDAVVLLPLICLGLERLMQKDSAWLYVLTLALAMFSNYYIAYMICLFLVLYFFYRLPNSIIYSNTKWDTWDKVKFILKRTLKFAWYSLLAAGLAAILLLPTVAVLSKSKGGYASDEFLLDLQYPIQDIFSKFVIGAFNFDQLPDGLPNIFMGSFVLILFFCFFFNKKFSIWEKINAGLVSLILILSMNVEALDKIWHGFQFPIWFPFRFSFVFVFFIILLAYQTFKEYQSLPSWGAILGFSLTLIVSAYVLFQEFDYVKPPLLMLTIVFYAIFFIGLSDPLLKERWTGKVILVLAILELGLNAGFTLDELSHVDHSRFTRHQQLLDQTIEPYRQDKANNEFYRMEKTFQRSKNDSFQSNFYSASHFSSTHEVAMPYMYGALGFPGGSGYTVYSNGTIFTDSFFGIKYYYSDLKYNRPSYSNISDTYSERAFQNREDLFDQPSRSTNDFPFHIVSMRPDLEYYPLDMRIDRFITVHENPYAQSIAFPVNDYALEMGLETNQPLFMQNELFYAMTGIEEALFKPIQFDQVETSNIQTYQADGGVYAAALDYRKPAKISYSFTPDSQNPYYFTFNPSNKVEDLKLRLNGNPYIQYETYNDLLVMNLAAADQGRPQEFTIEFDDEVDNLNLTNMILYEMDMDLFKAAMAEQEPYRMEITNYRENMMEGEITLPEGRENILFTLPYDESWEITIDGEKQEPIEAMDSLLAVKTSPGKHQIRIEYKTPLFWQGASISVLSLLALIASQAYMNRKKKKEAD